MHSNTLLIRWSPNTMNSCIILGSPMLITTPWHHERMGGDPFSVFWICFMGSERSWSKILRNSLGFSSLWSKSLGIIVNFHHHGQNSLGILRYFYRHAQNPKEFLRKIEGGSPHIRSGAAINYYSILFPPATLEPIFLRYFRPPGPIETQSLQGVCSVSFVAVYSGYSGIYGFKFSICRRM